jgi:hypothetical protein
LTQASSSSSNGSSTNPRALPTAASYFFPVKAAAEACTPNYCDSLSAIIAALTGTPRITSSQKQQQQHQKQHQQVLSMEESLLLLLL